MRLEGKVAIITGGARGQGAAEARLFAREGAKVVFGDVLDEEGAAVQAEISRAGREAVYVHLDVTSEADWQRAVDLALSRFRGLHVLVNNAGIWREGVVEETPEENWGRDSFADKGYCHPVSRDSPRRGEPGCRDFKNPDGQDRDRGRDRLRSSVSRLGRGVLRHRDRAGHRRRHDRPVTATHGGVG